MGLKSEQSQNSRMVYLFHVKDTKCIEATGPAWKPDNLEEVSKNKKTCLLTTNDIKDGSRGQEALWSRLSCMKQQGHH